MLACVIDAQEVRNVAVVDIPNTFTQTVVSYDDAEHQVIVRIQEPWVDMPVSITLDLYGPYMKTNKSDQQV